MNKFIVNENKQLIADIDSDWYAGEDGFEHLQVFIPDEISGNDMSEWLTGIKLVVARDGFEWEHDLTFTESEDGGYESDIIDADAAWCMAVGMVYFRIRFSKESDLGITNTIGVYINPSDQGGEMPYDDLASKDWVRDNTVAKAPDGEHDLIVDNKINDVYLPDDAIGMIYAGNCRYDNGDIIVTLTPEMQSKLGTEEATAIVDTTDERWFNTFMMNTGGEFYQGGTKVKASNFLVVFRYNYAIEVFEVKGSGDFDGHVPMKTLIASEPPTTTTGSQNIPNGTLLELTNTSTGKKEYWLCYKSEYNQGAYTYQWVRLDNVVHKSETLAPGESFAIYQTAKSGEILMEVPNYMSSSGGVTVSTANQSIAQNSNQWTKLKHYALVIHFPPDNKQTGEAYQMNMQYDSIVFDKKGGGQSVVYFPTESGTLAIEPTITTATLLANAWSNKEQTVNVTGVTADSNVYVSVAPSSMEDASASQIYCSAQGNGTLTFVCKSVPSSDIDVNIRIEG